MDDGPARPAGNEGAPPESVTPGGDAEELRRRCDTERDTMSPKETSDCAGTGIADAYENEEDGGS
jgi:hypothetical protein